MEKIKIDNENINTSKPTIKGFLRVLFLGERTDIDPRTIPEKSWRWQVIRKESKSGSKEVHEI